MFLAKNYLIGNAVGERIFSEIGTLPIIDAHNHADVAALARNENYTDLWQLFAATDHYVWEVMRKAGVEEKFITGSATPEEKFLKLGEVFDDVAGNPVYEWIHLDLRFLGIDEILNADTAASIWEQGKRILTRPDFRPLEILKRLNVEVMCSTDDPADTLENHVTVNQLLGGKCRVLPTWRPDKSIKLAAPGFREYLDTLGARYHHPIKDLDDLLYALRQSHDFFAERGCRASDHGIEIASSGCGDRARAQRTFADALSGITPDSGEVKNYVDFLMGEFGVWNSETDWVTQLHVGAVRDVRKSIFSTLGPDAGGDVSSLMQDHLGPLVDFLNRFDDKLKVVLYCLDPGQQPTLATLSRAFSSKVRLGSAWWLCDTPIGMKRQLEYIGSVDILSNFAGMVSDSRKLLSYGSRFEMFRRVLADVLGRMVESGQMPENVAARLAAKISYSSPKKFFNM